MYNIEESGTAVGVVLIQGLSACKAAEHGAARTRAVIAKHASAHSAPEE